MESDMSDMPFLTVFKDFPPCYQYVLDVPKYTKIGGFASIKLKRRESQ